MKELCMVYITASNRGEAMNIAEKLVDEKLAACVTIFDGVTSVYEWNTKLEKSVEAVLVVKTRESLYGELEKVIGEMHSDSCPCIVAYPMIHAEENYANWILAQTERS